MHLAVVEIDLHIHDAIAGEDAFGAGCCTPFSTDGTNTRSTFWPTSDCVNSTPVSRGFGSMRIQTSANCPAPPVCFLWRYFESACALIVSRERHARLDQFDVDVEAAAQPVRDHFQMQLALRGDDRLVQFADRRGTGTSGLPRAARPGPTAILSSSPLHVDLERRVNVGPADTALSAASPGCFGAAKRVAGVRVLEFHHRADVARRRASARWCASWPLSM